MSIIPVIVPTFVLQVGANGQLVISQVTGGDLSSATLSQLFSAQRDIAGATKLLEAYIIKNLT